MLNKIGQNIERWHCNKLIQKTFQRNLQTIDTKSAYLMDRLYFREWKISEYGKPDRIIRQSYFKGKPVKGSKIDYNA